MPLPPPAKPAIPWLPLLAAATAVLALQWLLLRNAAVPAAVLAIVAGDLAIGALLVVLARRLSSRQGRAERAEQRLKLAQDETGVGLFELNYQAETAYASPALCQILGQPPMDDGSMPLADWLALLDAGHVEDSRRTLEQKVAAGELRYERELRVELPDGSLRWLLSRIRLDLDEHGRLEAARGATLDITARKQLVTELQAAQAQLRQQLDDLNRLHSLSSRVLAMPELDGALAVIVDAACSFHGASRGALWLDEADGRSRIAAHRGLDAQELQRLRALGDAGEAALEPLARSLGWPAPQPVPLVARERTQRLGVLVVLDAPAGPDERARRLADLCAVQAAALIERDRALSLARDTQRRFEVALQSSAVAFTILAPVRDADGRLIDFAWTYANPQAAALIARPVEELVGRRVREVLPHAWDEPGFFERYVRVSEQGVPTEFETRSSKPGSPRWLHVIVSPLGDSLVVWFADVTQRRQEREALQDADRRKDHFLATLAHELRNPLAPIRHAVALLRHPAASEAQRDSSLAVIERQQRHMALLLDDLLDVSRVSRGTLPLRRVRTGLQGIVDTAVETARPLLDARGHALALELPGAPVLIDADPLRLAQVLGNLLVNAAKYTPPGGHVKLAARVEAGELRIDVSDDGQGLSPDDCERVFGMFTQLPANEGGPQGGLGIGLALARNLMQLHGGRLEAHSEGLGRGSTFTACLPLPARQAATVAEAPPVLAAIPAACSACRVLVADDNRDAADSLALLLSIDGHEVQVAYEGQEALRRYADFRPQIALLDLDMPGRSGAEVAREIRRQQAAEPVMLVAITGYGQAGDRSSAIDAGFDHHLTKPVELARLQALMRQAAPVTAKTDAAKLS
ncbi:MAG TPA: ATP-binding protein [Methylibium sp.]|uniref:hybrid sensor histidine kinase/response regulator n=1 Tax=Methylibium sp. TaxID=2067992 RepID=UPI002DBDC59A|nr:ATP-binding protein [Methylibium sp.]HEU4460059.1 ATP-binding protein [Methylibium sp.]